MLNVQCDKKNNVDINKYQSEFSEKGCSARRTCSFSVSTIERS
jgi:hypothetical protein